MAQAAESAGLSPSPAASPVAALPPPATPGPAVGNGAVLQPTDAASTLAAAAPTPATPALAAPVSPAMAGYGASPYGSPYTGVGSAYGMGGYGGFGGGYGAGPYGGGYGLGAGGPYGGYGGGMYGGAYGGGPMGALMARSQSLMQAINQPMAALSRVSQLLSMSFQSLHVSFSGLLNLAMGASIMKQDISNACNALEEPDNAPAPGARPSTAGFVKALAVTYALLKLARIIMARLRWSVSSPNQSRLIAAWRRARASGGRAGGSWGTTLVMSFVIVVIARYLRTLLTRPTATERDGKGDPKKPQGLEAAWERLQRDAPLADVLSSDRVVRALVEYNSEEGKSNVVASLDDDTKALLLRRRAELEAVSKDPELLRALQLETVRAAIREAQFSDLPAEGHPARDAISRLHAVLKDVPSPVDDEAVGTDAKNGALVPAGAGSGAVSAGGGAMQSPYDGYGGMMGGSMYGGGFGMGGYGGGMMNGLGAYGGMGGYGMGGYGGMGGGMY